ERWRMKQQPATTAIDDDLAQVIRGRGPCTYLMLALIALILLYPYLQEGTFARIALSILFSLVLLGGAFAIRQSRRALIFKSGLALVCIALQWTALWTENTAVLAATAMFYAVFLALTFGEVFNYILRRGPITADKLHGALAGYIMIAIFWAFVYAVVE